MYNRYDSWLVVKILRHSFKQARYIFKDRASVILSEQGICNHLPENFTATHQIVRWLDMLESVSVIKINKGKTDQFYYDDTLIRKQIDYLNLISSFCKSATSGGKAKLHY